MDARINGFVRIEPLGDDTLANIDLTKKLISLRTNAGLTQEGLGETLGVSRQAVSKWERGESTPDLFNLVALAKLYDISVDDILGSSPASGQSEDDGTLFEVSIKRNEHATDDISPDNEHIVSHPGTKATLFFALLMGASVLQSVTEQAVFFTLVPFGMAVATLVLNVIDQRKNPRENNPKAIARLFPLCWVLLSIVMGIGLSFGIWHPTWAIMLLQVPWVVFVHLNQTRADTEAA